MGTSSTTTTKEPNMPNCLRCGYAFKADLPEWLAVVTCDECQSALTAYFASSTSPRQAAARIKASRRLYAPAEVPSAGEVLPCEVDFTPEEAPTYDELVETVTILSDPEAMLAIKDGESDRPVDAPTHIDPMYEAVAAGEREAAARFRADRNALGFDG